MPPKMGRRSKKPKLDRSDQTMLQKTIDKLDALDLTFSAVPQILASELIAPLKSGLGLLGTAEEEEAYYDWYVQDPQGDEVSAPRSKDTTIINFIKEQRPTDQGISGPDLGDIQPDESSDAEEGHEQHMKTPAGEDSDEGISLDLEGLHFGRDFIEVDGEHIHATEYFGSKWTQRIVSLANASSYIPAIVLTYAKHNLYAVPPMEHPENMALVLHDHQLKGAAQMHFLCNSPFRGGVLADGMGVGKTHTSIAMMHLVKDEPGFSMVVAPKTLCLQWVDAIENAWQEVRLHSPLEIAATD